MSADISRVPIHEGLLFQRLRWRLWRNTLHVVLRRSLVRVVSILLCSLLVWASLFTICYLGFSELRDRWNFPLDGSLIGLLLDLLFVALTVLLIFSTDRQRNSWRVFQTRKVRRPHTSRMGTTITIKHCKKCQS